EIYSTPPEAIAVTSDLVRVIGERKEFAITPALGAKSSVHKRSYWYPENGRLTLVWTNGFSGLTMSLERTAGGLAGTAHTFWDFDRQAQRSDVSAQEVSCKRQ